MKCLQLVCIRNRIQVTSETNLLSSFRWFFLISFWFRNLAHTAISGNGTSIAVFTAARSFLADEAWRAWTAVRVRNSVLIIWIINGTLVSVRFAFLIQSL
jgi:hypothetical protein